MTIKSTFEDCLLTGTNAMVTLTDSLKDEKFIKQVEAAVNVICKTSGRLVISGMGKSGIIGKKLVATPSNTQATPKQHPNETNRSPSLRG
mgnify:CR=1 FL=1